MNEFLGSSEIPDIGPALPLGFAASQDPNRSIHNMPPGALALFAEFGVYSTAVPSPKPLETFLEDQRFDEATGRALDAITARAKISELFTPDETNTPYTLVAPTLDDGVLGITAAVTASTYTGPKPPSLLKPFVKHRAKFPVVSATATIQYSTAEQADRSAAILNAALAGSTDPASYSPVTASHNVSEPAPSEIPTATHEVHIRNLNNFALQALRRVVNAAEQKRLQTRGLTLHTIEPDRADESSTGQTLPPPEQRTFDERNERFVTVQRLTSAKYAIPGLEATTKPRVYKGILPDEASTTLAALGGILNPAVSFVYRDRIVPSEHPNPESRIEAGNLGLGLRRDPQPEGSVAPSSRQPTRKERMLEGAQAKTLDTIANPRTPAEAMKKLFTGVPELVISAADHLIWAGWQSIKHSKQVLAWRRYQETAHAGKQLVDEARLAIAEKYNRQNGDVYDVTP